MATILVIDDDPAFVEATTTLLKAQKYTVLNASHGDEGYALARSGKPDLILLDVMMKHDSEGFEVARKLNEDPATKNIPVILITGVRQAKGLPFGFEPDDDWLPVKAVLEKPVKPDEVLRQINTALS